MNRGQRRALVKRIGSALRRGGHAPDAVLLEGGPMDGWIVKPDAACLQPDWATAYRPLGNLGIPPSVAEAARTGGRYVLTADRRTARWELPR